MVSKLASVLLISVLALSAEASSIRCGTKLVTLGDTATLVKFKCGRPYATEDLGLIKGPDNRFTKLERIFYKQSSGQYLKILEFRNGRLVRIELGQRV